MKAKTSMLITPTPQDWDAFVLRQSRAHLLQLSAWARLKGAYGWTSECVALTDPGGSITAGAQILFRRLPLRLGTMAYLPMGPYVTNDALYEPLWQAIHDCSRKHRAAFLKVEPGLNAPDLSTWGFHQSPQTIQPSRTVLIDIRGDDETILARMNQGTRRKVRQSLKNDIHYYEALDAVKFNSIIQTTGERNEFGVHEARYYELAHDLFVPHHAALILAEYEGDVLAGNFVFAAGKTSWYMYGASSNVKRNLMASYGVQWRAMQWAKARGCEVYDMWGIPDEDEATLEAQFQERSDGLWGVYGFKRGWGGDIVRSAGAWDKVYNPVIYMAYKLALKFQGGAAG